jgi:phage repressor protein C with HTH and peptisase S24 domain
MSEGLPTDSKVAAFASRFRELRTELGLTQEQIAQRLGVTTATYNRYEKGHRELAAGVLRRMAELVPGISAEWLLTGRGAMFGAGAAEAARALLRVPLLEHGWIADESAQAKPAVPNEILAFGRDWLRRELKSDPERLFLMEMAGDAMIPTLLPGEPILVHQNEGMPMGDGIHVLRVGGAIQVRRLQWISPEELEIIPDNPLYKSRIVARDELHHRTRVIGRVVWCSKRL